MIGKYVFARTYSHFKNGVDNIKILINYLPLFGKIWPFLVHLEDYRLN